jgi:hypothetical protein
LLTATVEQLEKVNGILQQLDHATTQKTAENRRQAPRVNVRLPLEAFLLGPTSRTPIQIFTRNLSVSGVGFVSRRLFKDQERIAIRLRVKNMATKLCLARVTFGRYLSAGMHEMGAEFLECVKDTGHTPIPRHWMVHTIARIGNEPAPGGSVNEAREAAPASDAGQGAPGEAAGDKSKEKNPAAKPAAKKS